MHLPDQLVNQIIVALCGGAGTLSGGAQVLASLGQVGVSNALAQEALQIHALGLEVLAASRLTKIEIPKNIARRGHERDIWN